MFGSSMCTVTLCEPEIAGLAVEGETFTNGGGEVGYGFLYIPSKHCAISIRASNRCVDTKKIKEADFFKTISDLGIQIASGKKVKVESGLADVITNEKGTFIGLEELQKRYGPSSPSAFWFARQKVKELYFSFGVEKTS